MADERRTSVFPDHWHGAHSAHGSHARLRDSSHVALSQVIEWGPRSAATNAVCPVRALTRPSPNPFAQMRSASTSASCALLGARPAALEPTLTPSSSVACSQAARAVRRSLEDADFAAPPPRKPPTAQPTIPIACSPRAPVCPAKRDRVVRRGLGLIIGAPSPHPPYKPRARTHTRPALSLRRVGFLRDRRGTPTLRRPTDLDPLLHPGDVQLRRALCLLGKHPARSHTCTPLALNAILCIADLRQLRLQL